MNTKLVYVVISNDQDIYLEQAWASAYSARYYNPNAYIVFFTDEETKKNILQTPRKSVMTIINEIITIPFQEKFNNMQRSRYIKTNLRNLIEGDILFIDTDTVITKNIEEIDKWQINIGAVQDLHCSFDKFPFAEEVRKAIKKIYGINQINPQTEYFNSGVLYIKDTPESRSFFSAWHKNWKYSLSQGVSTDQQSLIKTVNDMPNIITPISGNYNCQILGSIQYLHTSKIVHFFNAKWNTNSLNPFFDKDLYLKIKSNGEITKDIEYQLIHCKELFISPSAPICSEDIVIWNSPIFSLLKWINSNHKLLYRGLQFISRRVIWLIKRYCK